MLNSAFVKRLAGAGKYMELWLAALLFVILAMIVIPMPHQVIDVGIALNITISVLILMTAMYVTRVLDFSVFPAMLLVTTLLRIALSIASVRAILSHTAEEYHKGGEEAALGAAGNVIHAFGEFVTGGNAVIGIIIFIIITVVQFVIVAQGAGRVAEVAARFTLDAMPGKQMALDGEYNNRMITPEEYQEKRLELQAESDFYGSMDGAMKFVKGDAMAGILITLVSIIGGFVVGGLMGGMELGVAAKTFTVLSVGEGLVSQLPALLVSVSAGLVVTRAASPRNMGSELGAQLTQNPRALAISGVIIAALGSVPQMPNLALWTMAIACGGAAWFIDRKRKNVTGLDDEMNSDGAPGEEIGASDLRVDQIQLEVGAELEALADPTLGNGVLLERLKEVRKRIAMEFGVIAPGVRVRAHHQLPDGGYQIRIKGDMVAEGHVLVTHELGVGQDLDVAGIDGEETQDPIFGTPALWVPAHQVDIAKEAGLQLFEALDVVATHVAEIIKQHLDELLTREEVQELLNMARQDNPTVVAELVPNLLTLGQIRLVLQNLVAEQVPVKDLGTILNALADQAYQTKDVFQLTEFVRAALGRKICQRYQSPDGSLRAFTLDPNVERQLVGSISLNETGQFLALDPDLSDKLHNNLAGAIQDHRHELYDVVILCQPKLRRFVKKLFERAFPKLVVMSYSEVVSGVHIENIEMLGFDRAVIADYEGDYAGV